MDELARRRWMAALAVLAWLTQAAYIELGGITGALHGRADRLIDGLDLPSQRAARRLLVRLVSVDVDSGRDARRRAEVARLRPSADEDAARKQLREHEYGPDTRSSGGGGGYLAPPELTEEERIVEGCLAVARQHGIQDPFRVAQQAKKWTRMRWDEAYLRYRTAQLRRQTPVDEEDGLFRPFA